HARGGDRDAVPAAGARVRGTRHRWLGAVPWRRRNIPGDRGAGRLRGHAPGGPPGRGPAAVRIGWWQRRPRGPRRDSPWDGRSRAVSERQAEVRAPKRRPPPYPDAGRRGVGIDRAVIEVEIGYHRQEDSVRISATDA